MIDILLFITVQLQARLRANHLRYQQLITVAVVRGFAQLQKFVAAIAPEVGRRNWEAGTSPFIRFGIQLYHAFLKPFCFGMAKCIMWG